MNFQIEQVNFYYYVIVILIVVALFMYFGGYFNKLSSLSGIPNVKGSYIVMDDNDKTYPNLMIVLSNKKVITAGIFDKDFKDYVGNPTYEQLQVQLAEPNVFNFDEMTENEFIKKFGSIHEELYLKYRAFSIGQMYMGDQMDISKEEFVKKYEDDLKKMNVDAGDTYDKLKAL